MFSMFPCSNAPDLNDLFIIMLSRSLVMAHSFESGVLEEKHIYNMQGRVSLRTRVEIG